MHALQIDVFNSFLLVLQIYYLFVRLTECPEQEILYLIVNPVNNSKYNRLFKARDFQPTTELTSSCPHEEGKRSSCRVKKYSSSLCLL